MLKVWFNAPHGPWEVLPAGEQILAQHYKGSVQNWAKHQCLEPFEKLHEHKPWQYRTMIAAMDRSIGEVV